MHEVSLHFLLVSGRATQRELDAGSHVAVGLLDALSAGEAQYRVDVEPLLRDDFGGCGNLLCGECLAYQGEDVAVLALLVDPCLVLVVAYGGEGYLHLQFGGLEEQFLHHLSRLALVYTDEDAKRESGVDVCLTDVEYLGFVACQYLCDHRGESRAVLTGNVYQYLFKFLVVLFHSLCILMHRLQKYLFSC